MHRFMHICQYAKCIYPSLVSVIIRAVHTYLFLSHTLYMWKSSLLQEHTVSFLFRALDCVISLIWNALFSSAKPSPTSHSGSSWNPIPSTASFWWLADIRSVFTQAKKWIHLIHKLNLSCKFKQSKLDRLASQIAGRFLFSPAKPCDDTRYSGPTQFTNTEEV